MIGKYIIGFVFVIIALVQDIRFYKIKNRPVLIFLVISLIVDCYFDGTRGLVDGLIGGAVPLVLIPLFAVGMLGAGDIKAFCVLGSLFGAIGILEIIIFSVIFGGVIAFSCMVFRKNGFKRFKTFFEYLKMCFILKKPMPYQNHMEKDAVFRFAYAIVAGFTAYAIYNFAVVV